MVDNVENEDLVAASPESEAPDHHPQEGIASEGFSSPQGDPSGQGISGASCDIGQLILKRSGAETDIVFPINPPAIIGRFDPSVGPIDVDLAPLPEGSYVSRKHAKLTCDDGVWKVTDLGSSNGTFVLNGDFERVEESEIHDGQELAFGNARFMFRVCVPEG